MKFTRLITTAIAVVMTTMIGVATAPIVSADPNYTLDKFGNWERLHGDNGVDVTYWKVQDLQPSSATIPEYQPVGTLWESNATVRAERGNIMPWIHNFNARVINGPNYRAIWQYVTPDGVPTTGLAQGTEASGKIYFDVTGPDPTIVVYANGAQDLMIWAPMG